MGIINKLDIGVANLIAAGEVVDRPSSVLKELIENSIDAGSTKIDVEIKNGGVSYIRVTDNGSGIAADDLPVAVLRHATSKIHDADDLDGIVTLGFRGEALAAISAVSKVRILSKIKSADNGALLESENGNNVEVSEVGCADGTTVIVEELFLNVPARRKFLKRDITETMACNAVVEKLALSRPDIAFKFFADGTMKFSTAGDGNSKNAVYALLGRDFAKKLIEINGESDGVKVKGFIGTSDNFRSNRNLQNFFVNSRFVKSKTAEAALSQAYTSYMAEERFPVCVIYISIPPNTVDVNVHPTKLEVKFSNEKTIFEAIYYTVRTALENATAKAEFELPVQRHEADIRQSPLRSFIPIGADVSVKKNQERIDFTPKEPVTAFRSAPSESFYQPIKDRSEHTFTAAQIIPESIEEPTSPLPFRIIGIAFNTYIIVEQGEKLLLIDKHAAHERIIFEKLKRNLKHAEKTSQKLLVPLTARLSYEEASAISEFGEKIIATGYEYTIKNNDISISEIPTGIDTDEALELFITMAHSLSTNTGDATLVRDAVYEKALYQMSCKAAVKGGRSDSPENIEWICNEIMSLPDIKVCPHGRPVVTELEKRYIDRQFDRLK